jgi:hypothetical protein
MMGHLAYRWQAEPPMTQAHLEHVTGTDMTSFSEKQAAYAAWRNRLRTGVETNQVIDLTEEESTDLGPEWSTESLFVASTDEDE